MALQTKENYPCLLCAICGQAWGFHCPGWSRPLWIRMI